MFIPTRVIFCETTCDQMMKNDFLLCEFLLVETINRGAKNCLNTTVSHIRLCLNTIDPTNKFSQSSWAVCTSKPEQQMPSAFHAPTEHNSSHKKTDNTQEDWNS
jgi:hypothetical protein